MGLRSDVILIMLQFSLQWRHNGRDSVSNHRPHECLLNLLFRGRSNKTPKLRVTGLCAGNSPGTGEFHAQMASNAENVSFWWRHDVVTEIRNQSSEYRFFMKLPEYQHVNTNALKFRGIVNYTNHWRWIPLQNNLLLFWLFIIQTIGDEYPCRTICCFSDCLFHSLCPGKITFPDPFFQREFYLTHVKIPDLFLDVFLLWNSLLLLDSLYMLDVFNHIHIHITRMVNGFYNH